MFTEKICDQGWYGENCESKYYHQSWGRRKEVYTGRLRSLAETRTLIPENPLQGLHGHLVCTDCSHKAKDFCQYFVTERCFDKVGTDTCKWRVQNGHPCSVGYMKLDCIKTCVCGTLSINSTKYQNLMNSLSFSSL